MGINNIILLWPVVSAEAAGAGSLPDHAEDHPPGPGPSRPAVPEGLGPGRVPEEQDCHQPGELHEHPIITGDGELRCGHCCT